MKNLARNLDRLGADHPAFAERPRRKPQRISAPLPESPQRLRPAQGTGSRHPYFKHR